MRVEALVWRLFMISGEARLKTQVDIITGRQGFELASWAIQGLFFSSKNQDEGMLASHIHRLVHHEKRE